MFALIFFRLMIEFGSLMRLHTGYTSFGSVLFATVIFEWDDTAVVDNLNMDKM